MEAIYHINLPIPPGDIDDSNRLKVNALFMVKREPLGVCGAIIPWNMPVILMGWKIGPALLAGNTMVFKPASSAPLTNLAIASLAEQAGLPPGVLNTITGRGEVVGEGMVRHRGISKISFTGDLENGGPGTRTGGIPPQGDSP